MRHSGKWFMPIFKLNRYYAGNEVSGFEILGIEVDLRPWYISRITREDLDAPGARRMLGWYDKNGWSTCWDTRQERDEALKENPKIIFKRVSIPNWLDPRNIAIFFIGVAIGFLLA